MPKFFSLFLRFTKGAARRIPTFGKRGNIYRINDFGTGSVSAGCLGDFGRCRLALTCLLNDCQLDTSEPRLCGGLGLGLYITKKFTELLDGKITVESEIGEGSTFTVAIPYST